jgi:hypothetical protein
MLLSNDKSIIHPLPLPNRVIPLFRKNNKSFSIQPKVSTATVNMAITAVLIKDSGLV